jgi:hypothetical protein
MKWLLANLRRRAVFAIHFRRCIVEQLILRFRREQRRTRGADYPRFLTSKLVMKLLTTLISSKRVVSGEAIILPLAPQAETYTDSRKKSR